MLKLDYLWVDSLCILQDSPTDMAQEIGRMDSIYSNAFLTISASCVRDCNDSILHDRGFDWDSSRFPFKCDDGQSGTITLAASGNYAVRAAETHRMAKDNLSSRAWAFQESFLSRRMLIFSRYQLFWVCGEIWGSDGGHTTRDQYFSNMESSCRLRKKVDLVDWLAAAEEYSTKTLSVQNDKLPALSSIASYFEQRLNDTYLAGMWLTLLPYQLCWAVGSVFPSMYYSSRTSWQRPAQWRAPSWSYLSIDAQIKFPPSPWRSNPPKPRQNDVPYTSTAICCSVIGVELEPMFEAAKFGRLKDKTATLRLQGELWQYLPKRRRSTSETPCATYELFSNTSTEGALWYDTLEKTTGDMAEKVATCYELFLDPEASVWLFPLFSEEITTYLLTQGAGGESKFYCWGLVLSRLPDGRYHRIGIFHQEKGAMIENWKVLGHVIEII
jgi:hypothetical protein